jgi:hypothetical protein
MNKHGRESLSTSMSRWCAERFPNVWALGVFRLAYVQCSSGLIFPKSQRRSHGRRVWLGDGPFRIASVEKTLQNPDISFILLS